MWRSPETSCAISAFGNNGARSSGPTGCRVPGCSGGGGGDGRSAMMLYHCRGISDSCRRYLTWLSMERPQRVENQGTDDRYRSGDPDPEKVTMSSVSGGRWARTARAG